MASAHEVMSSSLIGMRSSSLLPVLTVIFSDDTIVAG